MKKIFAIAAIAASLLSISCSKMKNEIADLRQQVEEINGFRIQIDKNYPSGVEIVRGGESRIPYSIKGAGDEKVTVSAYFVTEVMGVNTRVHAVPSGNDNGQLVIYQDIIQKGWDDGFSLTREGGTVAIEAVTESGRSTRQLLNIHEIYFWQECLGGYYDSTTKTYTIELDKDAHEDQLGVLEHDLYEWNNCNGFDSYGEPKFYCECFKTHTEDFALDSVIKLQYKSGEADFIKLSLTEPESQCSTDDDWWCRKSVLNYSCTANTTTHIRGVIFEVLQYFTGGGCTVIGYVKFTQARE